LKLLHIQGASTEQSNPQGTITGSTYDMFALGHYDSNGKIVLGKLEIIIFEDFIHGRQRLWNVAYFIPKH
jgi:hypothetical protein